VLWEISIFNLTSSSKTRRNIRCYNENMFQNIQQVFWYIFVFSLSFQMVWIFDEISIQGEKWHYATGSIYFSEIVLFFLFLLIFFQKIRFFRLTRIDTIFSRMIKNKISFFLGMFFLWIGVSVFWALDKEIACKTFIHFISALFLWSILRWKVFSLKKTFYIFSLTLCVHSGLGIIQWTQQYSPEISYLGMSEYQVYSLGVSVLKNDFGRWLRVYGGFPHPNIFGGVLAIILLMSMFFYKETLKKRERIYLLSIAPLFVWSMIFTFSRSAWLSFVSGWIIITIGSIVWGKWNRERWFSWMLISGVVCISGVFFMFSIKDSIESRFSQEIISQEQSFSDRMSYVQQAKEIIQEKTLFGTGIGNFTVWTKNTYWKEDSYIALFQPVHLIPLLILAEVGLIGFLLFFILFVSIFIKIFKQKNVLALGLFGSFAFLMLFDHWLWTSHFGLLFLLLMVFFWTKEKFQEKEKNKNYV
jgi:O-antigen ligase